MPYQELLAWYIILGMAKGTLSSKNQITIPIEMVRALGLKPGDQLEFSLDNGFIKLKPQRLSIEEAIKKYATDMSEELGTDSVAYVRKMRGWEDW
jgi:AbrB family looped-hinge helix DNA binding protein